MLDDITIAGALKNAQCPQDDFRLLCFWCEMAKTYNSPGWSGHVDSADVWALDTMRCRGHKQCSFTGAKHMPLVGYDSSRQFSRTHRSRMFPMKLASRLANLLLGPTLMQRTCYDLGMQQQGLFAFQSQRPCQGVMRHNSWKTCTFHDVVVFSMFNVFFLHLFQTVLCIKCPCVNNNIVVVVVCLAFFFLVAMLFVVWVGLSARREDIL